MTAPPPDREPSASDPAGSRSRPPVTVVSGAVRVVFSWTGDRWRHVILVDGGPWAASVEGRADDRDAAWPPSPPLVELSATDTPHGPAVLGVGLAGRSHYSASVAACVDRPDAILVEIACRIRERPGRLGSAYDQGGDGPSTRVRVAAPVAVDGLPATVVWAYVIDRSGITPLPPATLLRGE